MANIGYSTGPKNRKAIGWARNIMKGLEKMDVDEKNRAVKQISHENTGIAALIWNILKRSLPNELFTDYDLLLSSGIPRMDCNQGGKPIDHHYRVRSGGQILDFTTGELAPSSALCASNYAR